MALKHGRPLLFVLLSMVLAACESSLGGRPSPQNYSCGTPVISHHCYAAGRLGDHLTGFRSTITVVGRILPGDGFITNEFWLVNDNNGGVDGWIEVGYIATRFHHPNYFWAMKDATTGIFSGQQDIGIDRIPQEEIDTGVVFDIHQTAEDTFLISIDGSKTHFSKTIQVHLWNGTNGGYVQLGQELAGSVDAVAPFAMFANNQVYNQHFQRRFAIASDGHHPVAYPSEEVFKPPYGGWMQIPAAGNQGGVFSTYCCSP